MKNLKKENVYVVVDTPKKAKKLKRLLDMFGEKYGNYTFELLENKSGDRVYFNMGSEWNTDTVSEIHIRRQEVSIEELKNILAVEHLKEGDVIIAGIGSTKYIVNVENVTTSNIIPIRGNKWICIDDDDYTHIIEEGKGGFRQFIRYATEKEILLLNGEEKQLLNPKKELVVGKWYILQSGNLVFSTSELINKHISGYGFSHGGTKWSDEYPNFLVEDFKEATPQEVEKALIEEAKRRYKDGDKVLLMSKNVGGKHRNEIHLKEFSYLKNNVQLYCDGNLLIFDGGQWATTIEQDKFAELKEAHSKGVEIQVKGKITGNWNDIEHPTWNKGNEYRIKPEEPKPKVGDVCKFWDDDENAFVIAKYAELREDYGWDDRAYTHPHGVRVAGNYHTRFYKKAKPLTQQEAVELLFGKEEEVELIAGNWYEITSKENTLLQYNPNGCAKGWWNGSYGTWFFTKGGDLEECAIPASDEILKKFGVKKV